MGGCPTGTVPGSFPRGGRKRWLQTDLQNEIVRKIETLLECQSIAVDEHQQLEKMGEVAPTMYLGMDGTGVPMRTPEVADRAGKQADGSAKTREAKLVTIWTAESRDEEDQPARDPGSITYSDAIESAATLDMDTSPTSRTSRRAYNATPAVVVSPKLSALRCSAMIQPGFGRRLRNYSRRPLRSSTAFMPKNISARWERSFMGTAQKASPGSRYAPAGLI